MDKSPINCIPFEQGAMPSILTTVCALFGFLTFFFLSVGFFFNAPSKLLAAAKSPGYVIILPKDSDAKLSAQLPHQAHKDAFKDAMSFLSHMVSYMDEVISHREFRLDEYSPLLPALVDGIQSSKGASSKISSATSSQTSSIYIDIKVDRDTPLNTSLFKRDIEGIFPGSELVDRTQFFGDLVVKLENLSRSALFAGLFMAFSLILCVVVLLSTTFKTHAKTAQVLSYLGTNKKAVARQFLTFFKGRFLKGILIAMALTLCAYIPTAWVLDPSLHVPALILSQGVTLCIFALSGYIICSLIVKSILGYKCRQIA